MAPEAITDKLPTEVLILILEKLGDKRDILSQCLVSKKFRDMAHPLLFRELCIGYNTVISFTKFLISQPKLAKEVQVLTVYITEMGLDTEYDSSMSVAEEQVKFIQEHEEGTFMRHAFEHLSNKVGPAFKMFWLSQFSECQYDAYLALLLSFLPNVEYLSVAFDSRPVSPDSFLQLALKTVAENSNSIGMMGKLKKLSIDHTWAPNTPSALVPLFAAPCLEEISISSMRALTVPLDIGSVTLNVTSIRLDVTTFNDPVVSAPAIAALIRACPRLQKFSAGYLGWQNDLDSWLETVCKAVRTRASTLETLSLVTSLDDAAQMPMRFDSLTGFDKLKNLHVPEHLMLGAPADIDENMVYAKTLPSSIEKVYFTRCTPQELKPLVSIVNVGRDSFPVLEHIIMDFDKVADTRDDTVIQLMDTLAKLAERFDNEMGVQLSWKMKTRDAMAADDALEQLFLVNA